jgi:hypothetical protein
MLPDRLKLLGTTIMLDPSMSIKAEDLELHIDDPVLVLQENGKVQLTVTFNIQPKRPTYITTGDFMSVTLGTTLEQTNVGTFIGKDTNESIKREATRFADEMFKAFAAWRNG